MKANGVGTSVPSNSIKKNGTKVPPPGYKQTKVGVIPEDWDVVKLGDIASRITEKNKDDSIDKVFSNSAINGIVLQNEYFDREIANKNNLTGYYVVENGDFVYNPRISKTAPAGPINRNLHSSSGIVSPLYTVFRTQKNENINYLEYFFSSTLWFRYMQGIANYGARHDRMNITNSDFMKMQIPYPPLKEQEEIAQILGTWDDAIIKQEQLIVTKETLKKGLMQRLLSGEVRFDRFDGEWEEVKLGSLTKFYLGLTYTPTYVKKGIPFLSVKDIKGSLLSFKNTKYISVEEFENSTSNAKPKKGDILFGRVGTLGNPIIVETNIPFCIFVSLGFMRVNNDVSNVFIKHWMNSIFFKKQVESQVAGSSQKNLNVGWLKNFKLKLPPKEEQQKISQVLTTADKEIELLKVELEVLKEQKRGLIQRLLSGVVRVSR